MKRKKYPEKAHFNIYTKILFPEKVHKTEKVDGESMAKGKSRQEKYIYMCSDF